jgi:hypothetical protein
VPLPDFAKSGDLPPGIHAAKLEEVVARFSLNSPKRRVLIARLKRIHALATGTRHSARFVIFGSFVTTKSDPNDIDIFMIMDDAFDVSKQEGEIKILFDHPAAQSYFGASVFWIRKLAALGGEAESVEYWQVKRDGSLRGIVEVLS